MRRPYTRKLETPIGLFYLEYADNLSGDESIHCALLDNDKKWITNIYHKDTIKDLKKMNSIGELVDILCLHDCTWGDSIEELTDEINEIYFNDSDNKFSIEEMKNYDFLNKIGTTYFVINFE